MCSKVSARRDAWRDLTKALDYKTCDVKSEHVCKAIDQYRPYKTLENAKDASRDEQSKNENLSNIQSKEVETQTTWDAPKNHCSMV